MDEPSIALVKRVHVAAMANGFVYVELSDNEGNYFFLLRPLEAGLLIDGLEKQLALAKALVEKLESNPGPAAPDGG